jgi:uncharacterized protein YidB (DUF937 family)
MGITDLLMNELIAGPGKPLGVVIGHLIGGNRDHPDTPGVAALIGEFERAGLGDLAHSWVGPGPNQPLTGEQLRRALGEARVTDLVRFSGLPERDILPMVAEHLPAVVHQMTPDGHP